MCRALDTLAHGALRSKARAVSWAEESFPEPWRSMAKRSRVWRNDSTIDPAIAPDIVSFVHWVAADGILLFGEGEETK